MLTHLFVDIWIFLHQMTSSISAFTAVRLSATKSDCVYKIILHFLVICWLSPYCEDTSVCRQASFCFIAVEKNPRVDSLRGFSRAWETTHGVIYWRKEALWCVLTYDLYCGTFAFLHWLNLRGQLYGECCCGHVGLMARTVNLQLFELVKF